MTALWLLLIGAVLGAGVLVFLTFTLLVLRAAGRTDDVDGRARG